MNRHVHHPASSRDDRSRALQYFDFEAVREGARGRKELRRLLDEESARTSGDPAARWLAAGAFVASALTIALLQLGLCSLLGWSAATAPHWAWVIPFSAAPILLASIANAPIHHVIRNAVARRRAGIIARAAVKEGICGACGYPLESLEPEPDGCVVCPECGAAWRTEASAPAEVDATP